MHRYWLAARIARAALCALLLGACAGTEAERGGKREAPSAGWDMRVFKVVLEGARVPHYELFVAYVPRRSGCLVKMFGWTHPLRETAAEGARRRTIDRLLFLKGGSTMTRVDARGALTLACIPSTDTWSLAARFAPHECVVTVLRRPRAVMHITDAEKGDCREEA